MTKNETCVDEITYIQTNEGWLYCVIAKELCLKKVVDYAFSHRIDANLTMAALMVPQILQRRSR